MGGWGRRPMVAHCDGEDVFCLDLGLHTRAHSHTQPFEEGESRRHLIGPVGGAAVAGLATLGLLLHAVGLAALPRTTLQEISIESNVFKTQKKPLKCDSIFTEVFVHIALLNEQFQDPLRKDLTLHLMGKKMWVIRKKMSDCPWQG